MKFYLAGASAEVEACAEWIRRLEAAGHECTHNWTTDVLASRASGLRDSDLDDDRRLDLASTDMDAVRACRVFWLVIPTTMRSMGSWLELGAAIALGKRTVVSGYYRATIFTSLAHRCFSSDEEAFDAIVEAYAASIRRDETACPVSITLEE